MLSHVTGLMFHDAMILVKNVIFTVLKAILDNPIAEFVIKPCVALVEPIQAMIDEIPIPGMAVYLHYLLASGNVRNFLLQLFL